MATSICVGCGRKYEQVHHLQKYCSTKCKEQKKEQKEQGRKDNMALFGKKKPAELAEETRITEAKVETGAGLSRQKPEEPKITAEQEKAIAIAKEYMASFDGVLNTINRTDSLLLAILASLEKVNYQMERLIAIAQDLPDTAELPPLR